MYSARTHSFTYKHAHTRPNMVNISSDAPVASGVSHLELSSSNRERKKFTQCWVKFTQRRRRWRWVEMKQEEAEQEQVEEVKQEEVEQEKLSHCVCVWPSQASSLDISCRTRRRCLTSCGVTLHSLSMMFSRSETPTSTWRRWAHSACVQCEQIHSDNMVDWLQ